ncbi:MULTISPECIES: MerR family transcriptional regulator [Streptomyces]|uniref:MerR family transcriptional regulator n=1 Tax=Streptomyces TaxID=1883 RepID=UPI0004BD0D0A|nr:MULTISPECIES: MerR family transcriptional regulator [Streptomyces]KJY15951.1 MerR family transcriptional regulator [Streptomyces sp. NRRL S-104]KOU75140.1 MerR family transcriptional regulator [Streptomyces sp. IGB124]KOU88861.1 MerR family transcriptional regulator [Streptomyces sp. XY66]KOV26789.1 MerR family transcriptional regulator [Streptomyces sp. XY413]KOV44136.1 MerR family transcriptional regulator [Streptomyces sp. H021]
MADGLTIGQAAAFTGVTIKTVRHYHRLGLVAEPHRDGSGYRRYRSADLFRLVRVRTLAAAGVPLAEIGGLLDAGPQRFAATLEDVHRRLTEQIEDLTARRDRLHRLDHGDRALLPDRACTVLERLAGLGFGADYVAGQREALVLARAVVPEIFDSFLTRLEHSLDDPESVELTKRALDARAWDPYDPRIEELARTLADKLLGDRALLQMPTGLRSRSDAASRYGLVNHHREDLAPSVARLNALVEAHLRAAGIDVPRQ